MQEREISIADIGPIKAQTTAADVSVYLQSVRALKAAAKKEARKKPLWRHRKFGSELKQLLVNIHTDQKQRTAPTYEELGTPRASAKVLYEEVAPKLGEIEVET